MEFIVYSDETTAFISKVFVDADSARKACPSSDVVYIHPDEFDDLGYPEPGYVALDETGIPVITRTESHDFGPDRRGEFVARIDS